MTDERPLVKETIFGSEYTIRGEADSEYIQSLARMLDEKMKEVAQGTQLTSALKISILAGINLADEISRLKKHNGALSTLPASDQVSAGHSTIAPEAVRALISHIEMALNSE